MKLASILCLALSACNEAPRQSGSTAAAPPIESATATPVVTAGATSIASIAAPPRSLPAGTASREDREKAALDLLSGRAHAADLPLADVDPGEDYEPLLRFAMGLPMKVALGPLAVKDVDAQAIEKAVEHHMMRFRICYGGGLRLNPNLQGRVAVRVVLKSAGKPFKVDSDGSDVPDSAVVRCVTAAFAKIDFPAPSAEIGSAVVPVVLSPG